MYTISKEFHFSASHVLTGLPKEHPCSRLHGHNYIVRVFLSSETVDETGFVTDYRALEPIKRFIDGVMDHKHLNAEFPFNPTAENLARYLFERFRIDFPTLSAVEVSETPKTNCKYEG